VAVTWLGRRWRQSQLAHTGSSDPLITSVSAFPLLAVTRVLSGYFHYITRRESYRLSSPRLLELTLMHGLDHRPEPM
jgi:hypothetical protein